MKTRGVPIAVAGPVQYLQLADPRVDEVLAELAHAQERVAAVAATEVPPDLTPKLERVVEVLSHHDDRLAAVEGRPLLPAERVIERTEVQLVPTLDPRIDEMDETVSRCLGELAMLQARVGSDGRRMGLRLSALETAPPVAPASDPTDGFHVLHGELSAVRDRVLALESTPAPESPPDLSRELAELTVRFGGLVKAVNGLDEELDALKAAPPKTVHSQTVLPIQEVQVRTETVTVPAAPPSWRERWAPSAAAAGAAVAAVELLRQVI